MNQTCPYVQQHLLYWHSLTPASTAAAAAAGSAYSFIICFRLARQTLNKSRLAILLSLLELGVSLSTQKSNE